MVFRYQAQRLDASFDKRPAAGRHLWEERVTLRCSGTATASRAGLVGIEEQDLFAGFDRSGRARRWKLIGAVRRLNRRKEHALINDNLRGAATGPGLPAACEGGRPISRHTELLGLVCEGAARSSAPSPRAWRGTRRVSRHRAMCVRFCCWMNVAANARPHIDVSSGPSRHFGAGLQGEEASRREVNEGFLPSAPGGWGPFRCGRKRL